MHGDVGSCERERERERESRKVSSDIKCPAIPMCGAVNTGF